MLRPPIAHLAGDELTRTCDQHRCLVNRMGSACVRLSPVLGEQQLASDRRHLLEDGHSRPRHWPAPPPRRGRRARRRQRRRRVRSVGTQQGPACFDPTPCPRMDTFARLWRGTDSPGRSRPGIRPKVANGRVAALQVRPSSPNAGSGTRPKRTQNNHWPAPRTLVPISRIARRSGDLYTRTEVHDARPDSPRERSECESHRVFERCVCARQRRRFMKLPYRVSARVTAVTSIEMLLLSAPTLRVAVVRLGFA